MHKRYMLYDQDGGDAAGGEGTPAPTPAAITGETPLPDDLLPAGMAGLKGKSFKDMFDSHDSLRAKVSQDGESIKTKDAKIAALEKTASDASDPQAAAKAAQEAIAADQVTTQEYYQQLENYIENGEVSDEFVQVISEKGAKVPADEVADWFEFKKFQRQQYVQNMQAKIGDSVSAPDLFTWLNTGKSTFSAAEIAGFNSLAKRGNFDWAATAAAEYTGAGAPAGGGKGGRFDTPAKTRGRPVQTTPDVAFKDDADFRDQVMAVRSNPDLSPIQKRERERDLVTRRAHSRGEEMRG